MTEFTDTKPMGLYEAAIGEKNQGHYVAKFEDFDRRGPGLHASWNWAAFFFMGAWALYRKMYVWFFAWWGLATVATILEQGRAGRLQQIFGVVVLLMWLAFSLFANSLYHAKVKAKIATARKSNSDALKATNHLRKIGGVLTWVPIVSIGIPTIVILAAVALPAYQDYTKPRTETIAKEHPPTNWENGVITPPQPDAKPWELNYKPATPTPQGYGDSNDVHGITPSFEVRAAELIGRIKSGALSRINASIAQAPRLNERSLPKGSMPFCVELDNLKDTDAPIHQPAAMLVAAD